MTLPEHISITFSFNWLYFSLLILLIAGYVYVNYRFTIPEISKLLKTVLIITRTLALLLLLFLIFEPILTLGETKKLKAVHYLFLDNSESVTFDDGSGRVQTEKTFLADLLNSPVIDNTKLFSFDSDVSPFYPDSLDTLSFTGGRTNFQNIFSELKSSEDNIASLTIISDGAITDGSSPVYSADELDIPVFTIGLGDSTKRNDIALTNVLFNEFLYAKTPTTVIAVITNRGFAGESVRVRLFEENTLIDEQQITLSDAGLNNVSLDYTPGEPGEKKLTVSVEAFDSEFTTANNRKSFFITVFDNELKVLLLAGAPSPDIGFIANALRADTNITLTQVIRASSDAFLGTPYTPALVEDADILFLVNFPSKETPAAVLNKVQEKLSAGNTPFFFLLTQSVDAGKLAVLKEELPFTVKRSSNNIYIAQLEISADVSSNPLLQYAASDILSGWNSLAPVYMPAYEIETKAGTNVIATANVNNVSLTNPLIISRRFGNQRSLAILAGGIYKWKLRTKDINEMLFDSFIGNTILWLNTRDDKKQVRISTSQKFYRQDEQVQITAEVYDEIFNPIDNAAVTVKITRNNESFDLRLTSLGGGKFEAFFDAPEPGDYYYRGEASLDGTLIGSDKGRFSVGEVNLEFIDPFINTSLLQLLADRTGGRFFYGGNYSELFPLLENIGQRSEDTVTETNEFELRADYRLLLFIILLLGIEWFLRKREGMI